MTNMYLDLVEACLTIFFVTNCLSVTNKKQYLLSIITTIIYFLNTIFHHHYKIETSQLIFINLFILFLYTSKLQNKYPLKNLLIIGCTFLLSNIAITLGLILSSFFFDFPFTNQAYFIIIIISKIIYFMLGLIISNRFKKYNFINQQNIQYIFIAIMLLYFLYTYLINIVYYEKIFNYSLVVSFIVINLLSIYLGIIFFNLQKEQAVILNLEKDKLRLENEEKIQKINQQNINELNKWRHDLKYVFEAISYQLKNNNIPEIENIISLQQANFINQQFIVKTGNELLDSLLMQRYQQFSKNRIHLIIDCQTAEMPLEHTHFLIIAGNLLDNALENCKSNYKKEIRISLNLKANYFYLKIQNTITDSVLENNPSLQTTKENSDEHDIGLKNIKLLLKRYQGEISFHEENNNFIVRIIIPNS